MQDFVGVKDVIKPARLAQLSERRNGPGLIYLASHVGAIAANRRSPDLDLGQLVVCAVFSPPGHPAQLPLRARARV